MKKSLSFLLFLIVAFEFDSGALAKSFPKIKKKTVEHHETLITSVTGNSITVTENKTSNTFTITPDTEIDVQGQRSTIASLKPGMLVNITLGMETGTAGRINAQDAPVHHDPKK